MKIAYSGSHGTGKTTSAYETCWFYKKQKNSSVYLISETIRECPFPINQNGTAETNLWSITTQLKKELEKSLIYDIIICDRPVIDTLAYCYIDCRELYYDVYPICKRHINTYDYIYFKSIQNNDYLIDDGVRDMDTEYRQRIEDKLLSIYDEMRYKVIMI